MTGGATLPRLRPRRADRPRRRGSPPTALRSRSSTRPALAGDRGGAPAALRGRADAVPDHGVRRRRPHPAVLDRGHRGRGGARRHRPRRDTGLLRCPPAAAPDDHRAEHRSERETTFRYDAFGNVTEERRRGAGPTPTARRPPVAASRPATRRGRPTWSACRSRPSSATRTARCWPRPALLRRAGFHRPAARRRYPWVPTRREAWPSPTLTSRSSTAPTSPTSPRSATATSTTRCSAGWWFDEVAQRADAVGNPAVRRYALGGT